MGQVAMAPFACSAPVVMHSTQARAPQKQSCVKVMVRAKVQCHSSKEANKISLHGRLVQLGTALTAAFHTCAWKDNKSAHAKHTGLSGKGVGSNVRPRCKHGSLLDRILAPWPHLTPAADTDLMPCV